MSPLKIAELEASQKSDLSHEYPLLFGVKKATARTNHLSPIMLSKLNSICDQQSRERLRIFITRAIHLQSQKACRSSCAQGCATLASAIMADYNYGGGDEENVELKKLEAEVVCPCAPQCSSETDLLAARRH